MHILPQCLTNGFWKFICSIEEHLGESGAWKSHFHGLGLKMRVPQTVADMRSTQDPAKHGALARRCSPKFDTGCLLQCRRVAVKTASIGNRRFRGWVFQVTSVAVAVRLKLCSHYSAPHFLLRQQKVSCSHVCSRCSSSGSKVADPQIGWMWFALSQILRDWLEIDVKLLYISWCTIKGLTE